MRYCFGMRNSNLFWKIGAIVFAIAFVCVVVFLYFRLSTSPSPSNNVQHTDIESTTEHILSPEDYLRDNPIDFSYWQSVNSEIYAWLYVPNTIIDYPVVQSNSDDSYYLRRDLSGQYFVGGTLFTQSMNKKDFSDRNTVIYGHCMSNGTYFADLHKYRDETFFEENSEFYIYTPGHILTYRVFAAYEYDNRHILLSYDLSDDEIFTEYIESCLNPSTLSRNVRDDITLDLNSKILTLSTCVQSGEDGKRYLVQGVLISDESTK